MEIPNELYTAFSFIGFVMCAIPFYWHLEAWNTGTCLYMAWTGIGCLMQCVNSIVWNNNMINRVPVYCDISTRIQVALNAAIPACSLCINRRLYKIANVKAVMVTRSEKRRAVMIDLLIGLGIPLLQVILQYIVSGHRYNIFEDFGPSFSIVLMPPSFFLFYAWPVAIGCVSFVYCALTIYTFCKRERQFRQIMSSNRGLNRSRYIRLMVLSGVEMLFTIPLGTFFIVYNANMGVTPWISWEDTHSNYHRVVQVAGFMWKNNPNIVIGLEMERWSYVLCAFIFFAFFGFADEARQHYRLVYNSLASRVGYSTSSGTFHASSHGTSSFPHMKSKGGVTVSVVTTGDKRDSTVSFTDQLSIPSLSIASDLKPDFKIEEYSPTDSLASSSVDSFGSEQPTDLPELNMTTPAVPPASVPPSHPDTTKSTIRAYSGDAADSV
jgi:pheromone a factor receptor